MEEIKHLGDDYFCVTQDGKKKLYGFGKYLSNDTFDQIEICPECRQTPRYDCDSVYFAVKRKMVCI